MADERLSASVLATFERRYSSDTLVMRLLREIRACWGERKPAGIPWTAEWPTVPGTYLYYGRSRRTQTPTVCTVQAKLTPENRLYIEATSEPTHASIRLYKDIDPGYFVRLDDALPNLDDLKRFGGESA